MAQDNKIESSGSVGIGTTNPKEKLHLEGSILLDSYNLGNDNGIFFRENFNSIKKYNLSILNYDHSNSGASPDDLSINAYDGISFSTGSNTRNERMRINLNGNVGIGTLNPQRKLQISSKGASTADQPLKPEKWQVGIGNADGDDQGEVLIGTYGKQPAIQGHGAGTNYKLLLNPFNGNVGIGTYNPGSWKLAVNGKIRTKEIKVETGWSDFVFENDYKLPTLKDVENYIQEKGHLKDIPSAKEVAENGIFLG